MVAVDAHTRGGLARVGDSRGAANSGARPVVLTSATQVLLFHRCGLEVPHPSLPRSEQWKWKLTDDGDARDCVGQGSRALGHAVATVSMSREDMKLHALGQQQWEAFHARHASVQGTSAIERELDIDCSTVRNCRSQPWPRAIICAGGNRCWSGPWALRQPLKWCW